MKDYFKIHPLILRSDISISNLEEEHARLLLRQKEMDKQAEVERKRKEEENRRHGKYWPQCEKTCLLGLRLSNILFKQACSTTETS